MSCTAWTQTRIKILIFWFPRETREPSLCLKEHQELVLNIKKSQLPKTLGVGAWLSVFPDIMNYIGCRRNDSEIDFKNTENNVELKKQLLKTLENLLYNLFKKLEGKIVWNESDYHEKVSNSNEGELLPYFITGTNKVAINKLGDVIKQIL